MLQLTFTLEAPEVIALTRRRHLRWIRWSYWPAGIVLVLVVVMGLVIHKWEGLLLFGLQMVLLIGFLLASRNGLLKMNSKNRLLERF